MKYSILGFNQQKCLQLTKKKEIICKGKNKIIELCLDVTDLLILRTIADFMNRDKVLKILIEDKMYCWVKYSAIIEDLPILGIKQQALADRIAKMVELDLIEKQVEHTKLGSLPYFRVGKKYEELLYDKTEPKSSEIQVPTRSELQVHNNMYNNNTSTIYPSTKKEKEDNKLSSQKKDDDLVVDLPKEDKPKRQKTTKHESNWRKDFRAYKEVVDSSLEELMKDGERKKKVLQLYPSADYERTVMKWFQFWGSEKGWDCKKKSTAKKINMLQTFDRNYDKSIVNKSYGVQSPPPRVDVLPDGEWADGTYVLNGYRYYDSPKTGQRISISKDAPARPNEWAEYDYKSNNWITPIEHDDGIFY